MPPTFVFGSTRLGAGDAGFAKAVAAAHLGRIRPRCACIPEGVEMYVAVAGEGFVIKRMPYTSERHAVTCGYAEKAPAPQRALRRRTTSYESLGDRLVRQRHHELADILHSLWARAELTHWHPSFNGKRHWGTVRTRLIAAARSVQWLGVDLADRLYIPETFWIEDREHIEARRRVHWVSAQRYASPQLLLVGELKRIEPSGDAFMLTVRHLPDEEFHLAQDLYAYVSRTCASEIALWSANPDGHLVVIATIDLSNGSRPVITGVALMVVTSQWLPAADAFDLERLQRLVRNGRSFVTGVTRTDERPARHERSLKGHRDNSQPMSPVSLSSDPSGPVARP